MSIFFDLFSPGNQHRQDELDRLEHTREVEGVSEPGRGPVDLNSGVVLIKRMTTAPAPEGTEAEASAADDGTAESRVQ